MIDFNAKNLFFDRPAVMRAVGDAARRVLSKFGAYVRRRSRSSIRKRKRESPIGQPPSSHTGDLKDRIFFAYSLANQSVVIGPEPLNIVYFGDDGCPVRGTVPEVLEYGGSIRVLEYEQRGHWWRADLRSRRRLKGKRLRKRAVGVVARPFMTPAFETEKQQLPSMWANSVR